MSRLYQFFLLISFLLFLTSPVTHASYVSNGSLVIMRSQFFDNANEVIVDGVLNEDIWSKAGSLTIEFSQPDNVTITVYFTNTPNLLFFAIVATELPDNDHDSMLLTFDTDGNGGLTNPEDGIAINSLSQVMDYYWNGDEWTPDPSITDVSDFNSYTRKSNGKQILEMSKSLTPDDIAYDGFRIPNPSNTFISFNLRYIESQESGNTTIPVVFDFPTTPSNATGYIDLKLAGAEDQDLPEFIPPETFHDTRSDAGDTVFDTLGAALDASFPVFSLVLFFPIVMIIRRRNQS